MPDAEFVFDTRPPAETLQAWFNSLAPDFQAWLREHPLQVPFIYHGYPGKFAEGALANLDMQWLFKERSHIHKPEEEQKQPTMRFEFGMVVAFGGMDVFSWAKNKTWGGLNWIAPLQPEDPIDPQFLTCIHNPETSRWHKLRNQRWWMRRKCGRGKRGLVSAAMRDTKENWVGKLTTGRTCVRLVEGEMALDNESIAKCNDKRLVKIRGDGAKIWKCWFTNPPDGDTATLIRRKLGMTPGEFWLYAKGKRMLTARQMRGPQLTMF